MCTNLLKLTFLKLISDKLKCILTIYNILMILKIKICSIHSNYTEWILKMIVSGRLYISLKI